MNQLKDGVVLAGNKYINTMLWALDTAYAPETCTITAGRDGKHGEHSLHYQDRAVDARFWNVADKEAMAQRIRTLLPHYYDVVVEKDHFHIEADKKKEGVK